MPNLVGYTHTAGYWAKNVAPPDGVFSASSKSEYTFSPIPENSGAAVYSIIFSANNGNTIYGASATVMPASAETLIALYLGRPAQV